ncbi:hypothetical protein RF11_11577 [Thelohanellus kitauei]|uniref:Kelch domain-containing protein 10 n=1 Tax=Thelohanellus kitauei TaxID=669202 RepID=A0A0C2JWY3_THEKT|nr:hypothetical protein RF11_11577 [Thelohanellus kitauei]
MSGGIINQTGESCSDIWRIDLETLEWVKLDFCFNIGRYDHCMSVVDGCYLCSFGGERPCFRDYKRIAMFPVQLPSLYRLCLESLRRSPNSQSYIESLPKSITDELNINNND